MLQESPKLEVYATRTRIAQTGSLCYKNRTNWKFMLQEQESHKLEVYATRNKLEVYASHKLEVYSPKLEVYATRTAQTGSLCYKNRTNWKFMLSLCYKNRPNWKFMLQEPHKLKVYATRIAQTKSLCYESPKLEVYATNWKFIQESPNWKFMLQEPHKLKIQESHKLEVYATRTAQTKSLCYKNRTN